MRIVLIHSEYENVDPTKVEVNPHGPIIMKNTVTSVKEALEKNNHQVVTVQADGNLLRNLDRLKTPDLLINMSTGIADKRSQANIVGMLEMTGIPILGSGLAGHVLGLHKEITKSLLFANDIRTAPYQLVTHEKEAIRDDFIYPLMVKPEHEGSGIGVTESSIVEAPEQLRPTIKEKLERHQQVLLVEEYLPGREFTVGIIGNSELEILPIKETKFDTNGLQILTNDAKKDATSLSEIPAQISSDLEEEIRWMAEQTYRILRIRDFARIDFRLDRDGQPNVIELNTFPGMEKGFSFFPLIAEAAGYSYEDLLERLIEVALEPKSHLQNVEWV